MDGRSRCQHGWSRPHHRRCSGVATPGWLRFPSPPNTSRQRRADHRKPHLATRTPRRSGTITCASPSPGWPRCRPSPSPYRGLTMTRLAETARRDCGCLDPVGRSRQRGPRRLRRSDRLDRSPIAARHRGGWSRGAGVSLARERPADRARSSRHRAGRRRPGDRRRLHTPGIQICRHGEADGRRRRNGRAFALGAQALGGPFHVDEFVRWFTQLADESPLPIVVYSNPRTGTEPSVSSLAELAAHEKIAALKETSRDMTKVLNLCLELGRTWPGRGVHQHGVAPRDHPPGRARSDGSRTRTPSRPTHSRRARSRR